MDRPVITGSAIVLSKVTLIPITIEEGLGQVRSWWNHGSSYVGMPEDLEDIRLLLDQRSKSEDVKMPLVVYATVEMHESDRVLRQFGWRQQIPPPSQDMKELHKVDMQGKDNTDWLVWHKEHIEVWDRKMQSIPIREQFFSMDTAATDDYLAWFRTTDKLYMLSPEERSWQIRVKRSRQMPEHTRKEYDCTTSS
ncbi:hypothetical protein PVK06_030516 [Gossypium arboreum]|uniref:Aminotransferase-like plant mobile domain-containing protein n=1 Tax=Gossypium arboreum TaxID=29729 RepID=A0ABR0NNH9_GOSAR|nr:hypothetical protein PVK06_030516 [Gossypium arboreum]